MAGKQIRLPVPPKIVESQQLNPADDQAVNSRLLVRRQNEMHGSRRCYGELAELTVDAGNKGLRKLAHSNRRGTLEVVAEDNDGPSQQQQSCTALTVSNQPV